MNKTIEQWLQELPEPFREQAMSNMGPNEAEKEVEYISVALGRGFYWHDTDEGWDYWNSLHHHYSCIEMEHFIAKQDSSPLSP